MVTDHRGNVERWVGFVLYVLKEFDPESVEIQTFPAGAHACLGGNAVLTLRGMNLYQASARAMELVGWVRPPAGLAEPLPDGPAGASTGRGMRFDDPWADAPYPPPGLGRYVRFHRGDQDAAGEPEWRPAWAWAVRPEDGWVECGVCGSGSNRVLVARGRPPAGCDWLPPDWPAGFFPLGGTAEHLSGWRELTVSVLRHGQDTVPRDDPEYGWLTLTRATRNLAHHLGVIPFERVVTPLPASRDDARREAELLLDGLVAARRGTNAASPAPRPHVADAPPASRPAGEEATRTAVPDLAAEVQRLLAEARAGYASGGGLTIAAVPSRLGPDGTGIRVQRCADDSPDVGQIRDGVFYWPFPSIQNLGVAEIADLGRFVFIAMFRDAGAAQEFVEFCGRAAAALLAVAPPWAVINRPGPAMSMWPGVVTFLSPSARTHPIEQANGVRILHNPWAASIAALRDILSPPPPAAVPPPADAPPPPREVPTWDGTARRLLFRGQVCKQFARPAPNQELILAAFQEESWPDAIDDPLPGGKLGQTVESLNERLGHIKFRLNGAGTGVCWQPT
jgi:hypothetical protein